MKIAITGATGQLGRLIVSKLKEKVPADSLVAIVRSKEKAADLGIEAREADYDKPETLAPALQGIDTLLLISGSEIGKRAPQHKNVISAAKQAGISHIVYTSLLHADSSTINLAGEHRTTEAALKESGIGHTVLRNGWYTENYASSVAGAVASGAIIGSAGEGKISAATRADYAEAAVAVLTNPSLRGKTYELAGDTAFTLTELADEVARQTGKPVAYNHLPEAGYAAALAGFGMPQGLAQTIANWDVSASGGDLFDNSGQLSALIGRPTTPLAATVPYMLKGAS